MVINVSDFTKNKKILIYSVDREYRYKDIDILDYSCKNKMNLQSNSFFYLVPEYRKLP